MPPTLANTYPNTESSVYQRAYDLLDATAFPDPLPLRRSPWHYDLMTTESTREMGVATFAVAVLNTELTQPLDRQKGGRPQNMRSQVGVRVLYPLQAERNSEMYRAALALPQLIRATIVNAADGENPIQGSGDPQKWRFINFTNRLVGLGTHLLVELRFICWWHTATI